MSRSPSPISSHAHAWQELSSLSPFDQQGPPHSSDTDLRPNLSTRSAAYSPLGIVLDEDVSSDRTGPQRTFNRPNSRFKIEAADEESLLSHRRTASQPHVTNYDRLDSWNEIVKTGTNKLFITAFFGAGLCLCLKSWEGFRTSVPLSDWDVRVFNGLTIAISICLGLNLLASLKRYAVILRWSILTKSYVSTEVFDLILGIDELTNVTKLLALSIPGLRRQKWLLRGSHTRKGTKSDMNGWYPLMCCIWLLLNIGSQVLVASLSLFWPMEPYQCQLGRYGDVSLSNLTSWTKESDSRNQKEAAWRYGMDAQSWEPIDIIDHPDPIEDLSAFPGTPIYRGDGSYYEYHFFYRHPEHPYDDYVLSNRSILARATCVKLETDGILLDGNTRIVATDQGLKRYFDVPSYGPGVISWIGYHNTTMSACGSRCVRLTVLQYKDNQNIPETSLWTCQNTLQKAQYDKDDISANAKPSETVMQGTDKFAAIAAGAISWTGFSTNNWTNLQYRLYPQGTRWSPDGPANTSYIEDLIMRHTIGAIAAFDDHGNNFTIHINDKTCNRKSQKLNVGWRWVGLILGAIALIQLAALWYLLSYADRSIVRDVSFFSTAMLLKPVLKELDGEVGVMVMSGAQIKNHEKLQGRRIKYDYKEDETGAFREVTISFEDEIGQPKKSKRPKKQSWPSGSYT